MLGRRVTLTDSKTCYKALTVQDGTETGIENWPMKQKKRERRKSVTNQSIYENLIYDRTSIIDYRGKIHFSISGPTKTDIIINRKKWNWTLCLKSM